MRQLHGQLIVRCEHAARLLVPGGQPPRIEIEMACEALEPHHRQAAQLDTHDVIGSGVHRRRDGVERTGLAACHLGIRRQLPCQFDPALLGIGLKQQILDRDGRDAGPGWRRVRLGGAGKRLARVPGAMHDCHHQEAKQGTAQARETGSPHAGTGFQKRV